MTSALLSVVLLAAMGCASSQQSSIDSDEQPLLIGTWYIQCIHSNQELGLTFEERGWIRFDANGRAQVEDQEGKRSTLRYEANYEAMTIALLGANGEKQWSRFWLDEDTLMMSAVDVTWRDLDEKMTVLELSRDENGSPRQRALQDLSWYKPIPIQIEVSNENLQVLIQVILEAQRVNDGRLPSWLGELVLDGKVDVRQLFTAWWNVPLPDDFEDLPHQNKVKWLSASSAYTYLYGEMWKGGNTFDGEGPHLVLFESPKDCLNTIGMAFSDGSVRRVSRDEASQILADQTEMNLNEWDSILD